MSRTKGRTNSGRFKRGSRAAKMYGRKGARKVNRRRR